MLILVFTRMLRGKTLTRWHWPMTYDLEKSIGFQTLLRTKHVLSLVKIHWRMLILECSQGCAGRTVALLYPFATSLGEGIKMIIFLFSRPSRQLQTNIVIVNDYLVSATITTTLMWQHNWFTLLWFRWLLINENKQSDRRGLHIITMFSSPLSPFLAKNLETAGIWAWKENLYSTTQDLKL